MHAGTGLPKPPRHPCRSPHQALEAEQSPQFEILVLEPLGPPSALKVQLHMLPQHVMLLVVRGLFGAYLSAKLLVNLQSRCCFRQSISEPATAVVLVTNRDPTKRQSLR